MPVYRFEAVRRRVTKVVKCRGCDRKLTRSTTLEQTVNPYNRNADGTVKTRSQIVEELEDEAAIWHPSNDICSRCRDLPVWPIVEDADPLTA